MQHRHKIEQVRRCLAPSCPLSPGTLEEFGIDHLGQEVTTKDEKETVEVLVTGLVALAWDTDHHG